MLRITRVYFTAYLTLAYLRAVRFLGGKPGRQLFDQVFYEGSLKAFNQQGYRVVKFDPATEPAERPIIVKELSPKC